MTNENNDRFLLETFIRGLEENKKITQNLQAEINSAQISLAALKQDVISMDEKTDWLIKNIRDEGGDKSVMSRLLNVENHTRYVTQYIEEQRKKEDLKSKSLDNIAIEGHKGKWQLRIALATGCFGFIAAVVTTILSYLFKK